MRGSEDGALKQPGGDDPAAGDAGSPRPSDDPDSIIVWFAELADHAAISAAPTGDVVLAVRPVEFQPHPEPSARIAPWLTGALDDPTSPPEVLAAIAAPVTDPTDDRPPPPMLLDAHPDVRDEIELWMPFWQLWALAERHDKPARVLQAQLRGAHDVLAASDADNELVLAVGLLAWTPDGEPSIRRHLFVTPVTTEIDVVSGEVRVLTTGGMAAVELDSIAGRIMDPPVADDVAEWAKQYSGPLNDRHEVEHHVRRLTTALTREATYRPTDERPEPGPDPVVSWAPALILRRRAALKIAPPPPPPKPAEEQPEPSPTAPTEPSLESSPASVVGYFDDQEAATAVDTVTGDEPEIETDRPVEAFPPIEVPWADPEPVDADSEIVAEQMADAARQTRESPPAAAGGDRDDRSDRQEALLATLDALRRERDHIRADIAAARAADGPEGLVPYTGSRARIAERLAAEAEDHAWIATARVLPETAAPVSDGHMRHWVALRGDPAIVADADVAIGELLAPHRLPSVEAFERVIDDEERAHQRADSYGTSMTPMAETVGRLSESAAAGMRELVVDISSALGSVDITAHRWAAGALSDLRAGRPEEWMNLRAKVTALVAQAEEQLLGVDPNTSIRCSGAMADLVQQALTLRDWLDAGNAMRVNSDGRPQRRLRIPAVVADSAGLLERVRVNGAPPSSSADLDGFLSWARAGALVEQLETLWPSRINLDATDSVRVRLDRHRAGLAELDRLLLVRDKLAALDAQFRAHEIEGVSFEVPASVALFLEEVDRVGAHHRAVAATDLVIKGERRVQPFLDLADPPDWAVAFSRAIRTRDALAYAQVRDRVIYLDSLRENLRWCEAIEARLRPALGSIIDDVSDPARRDEWARRAGGFDAAWRWVAAKAWLEQGEATIRRHGDELRLVDERIDRCIGDLWRLVPHGQAIGAPDDDTDDLRARLRDAEQEADQLRTENAVLRQLGDMVPERPSDLDER
ncbi:MAG: hypothetical protein AAF480_04145 [Actinomycetota bacterium]